MRRDNKTLSSDLDSAQLRKTGSQGVIWFWAQLLGNQMEGLFYFHYIDPIETKCRAETEKKLKLVSCKILVDSLKSAKAP